MAETSRVHRSKSQTVEASPGAAAQIYDRLREDLISLRIEPGVVLNRLKLQQEFGLSSTPVRDALMRLEEEGLVEIFAQSATRVSLINVAAARQSQFLRRALEQEAIETVCLSPDRTVAHELKALIESQKDAAKSLDISRFEDLDREFHRRIFEAAGVLGLFHMVRRHSGHIDRIRRLHLPHAGKMQEIVRDHGQILRALIAGEAGEARARMRDHLSRSIAYSPKLREQYPTYFEL